MDSPLNDYIYAGKTDTVLELENTVSMTEEIRWGYAIDLVASQENALGDGWVVTSFATSQDWAR